MPYCVNVNGIPQAPSGRPIVLQTQFVSMVNKAFDTWQALPDIPPGTRVSMSLDLPEADRLPHDVQIKIRPGSVF